VAVIADSGALYALYDADDAHHAAVRAVVEKISVPLVVPVAILAEVDYLLREFLSVDAEIDFLDALASGAYTMEPLTHQDLGRALELIEQYRDLDLGVADSAVIATAERLGVQRILTVDERDFRAVRPRSGEPFHLLPTDGSE